MKFAINLESKYGINVFRLNNKNTWKICSNSSLLKPTNYQTSNLNDILSKQDNFDSYIKTNRKKFEYFMLGNDRELMYKAYCLRQKYPNPPDKNQLIQLLLKGNDSKTNIIVFKTDGQIYLLDESQVIYYLSYPEYVVEFQTFSPDEGYVGISINNNGIEDYVQNLFHAALYYCVKHLKDKMLHNFTKIVLTPYEYDLFDVLADYADEIIDNTKPIPEVINLFDELEEIKSKWTSDF